MKIFKATWRHAKLWLFVTSITLVIVITASLIATQNQMLRGVISLVMGGEKQILVQGDPTDPSVQYFTKDYSSKDETLKAANALNEKIVEEGIVLLKNNSPTESLLNKDMRVSVFGNNSVNMVHGGSGSAGSGVTTNEKTIYDSLDHEKVNIKYNPTLKSYYENSPVKRPKNPGMSDGSPAGMSTGEINPDTYFNDLKSSFATDYKDAAVVVFSRVGGEGFDLPRTMQVGNYGLVAGEADPKNHYLQLTNYETKLLDLVKAGGFGKIIIVINSSAPMELEFIKDDAEIDGAIWVGSVGGTGAMAIGKVLVGEVNPSGRLVDTYSRKFDQDPTWQNFGNNLEPNGNKFRNSETNRLFSLLSLVEYQENIYVGYRYYETRGFTEFEKSGNYNWYKEAVLYPFGYGLSYTKFDWEIVETKTTAEGDLDQYGYINVTVKVTNTGTRAGKDVVQLFSQAKYVSGQIEKSHVVLAGFAKTGIIQPEESELVSIKVKVSDLASYDNFDANKNNFKGWELDAGTYTLYISQDANSWTDAETLRLQYNVPVGGFKYDKGDKDRLTKNTTLKDDDKLSAPYDEAGIKDDTAKNLFDDVSGWFKEKNRPLLTRENFEESYNLLSPPSPDLRKIAPDHEYTTLNHQYKINDKTTDPWYVSEMPTYARKTLSYNKATVKLYELRGKDYFDPLWKTLLDQLSISQMTELIETGAFRTMNFDNIGKPRTTDPDGPAGFTNFMEMGGSPTVYGTCFYASECVIAATFNVVLSYEMGKMIGNEGLWGNVRGDGRPYSGWYAPAMNIHRSQFGGRNWEYYSEDGFLSGKMGSACVTGAMEKGVYTYLKHFVLNDQESERANIMTWATEQSMREIYFKPFEMCVKGDVEIFAEGYFDEDGNETEPISGVGSRAIMSSFNRIGTTWAGGSYNLQVKLLRHEWGFKGMIITDYNTGVNYMDVDLMIRAGGDINLWTGGGMGALKLSVGRKNITPTQVSAMRTATKNVLYTVVNSNAMNGHGEGIIYRYSTPVWIILLYVVNGSLIAIFGVWGFFAIRKALKKENQAK